MNLLNSDIKDLNKDKEAFNKLIDVTEKLKGRPGYTAPQAGAVVALPVPVQPAIQTATDPATEAFVAKPLRGDETRAELKDRMYELKKHLNDLLFINERKLQPSEIGVNASYVSILAGAMNISIP